jgi:phosphoribosylamine--glycine ligase
VLSVVGTGDDIAGAREVAYQAAGQIELRGGFYRRDIAAESGPGAAARA